MLERGGQPEVAGQCERTQERWHPRKILSIMCYRNHSTALLKPKTEINQFNSF